AHAWPWVKDLGLREEVIGQLCYPLPRELVFLAAAPQRAQPETHHIVAKGAECREVGRHGVIGEVAPHDLHQPVPLVGDRLMHLPSYVLLDLFELRPHAIASGFPYKLELALACPPADENEAQELEGFRFSQPALRSSGRRMAAKLDQAGLVRME